MVSGICDVFISRKRPKLKKFYMSFNFFTLKKKSLFDVQQLNILSFFEDLFFIKYK